jgi:hypothetical protein
MFAQTTFHSGPTECCILQNKKVSNVQIEVENTKNQQNTEAHQENITLPKIYP